MVRPIPVWLGYVGIIASAAKRNHRSLNRELLARPKASFDAEPVDIEALLRRIRLRRETIGQITLSDDTLRELRNAGRPTPDQPGLPMPAHSRTRDQ